MIRILHLTTDSKIAGAENLLISLARECSRSKFELFFCTLKAKGDLHKELEKLTPNIFFLECSNVFCLPRTIKSLIRILHKYKIDILHTHLFHAGVLGCFAAVFCKKITMITTRHYSNLFYLYGNGFERLLDRLVLKKANRVIAISEAVKDIITKLDGADAGKISVIPNGINLEQPIPSEESRMQTRHELRITDGIKLIGAIGSLHPRKGHEYLIRAAALICRERADVRFIIVGEGRLKEQLADLSVSLGVSDKIIFAGYRKDIPLLLAAMDIVVHPSVEEGFGISLLEAMFFSKAVVASNIGGIPEIIENGVTGLLVPAKDPIAIAAALRYFFCNPEKMKTMAAAAKLRVHSKFGAAAMSKNYENVYKEVLLAIS